MLPCVSVENMRRSDALTIEKYTPSLTLMYRAAMGVFMACEYKGKISIMCGGGNNGGDGYALACILADNGIKCTVYSVGDRLTPDSAFYKEKALGKGVEILPFKSGENQLCGSDIAVDCLLGTGFKGEVREPFASAIREINDSGAFTVSVDINSGLNGDTGEGDLSVKSGITVTIGLVKHGLVTENAGKEIGKLVLADIGIDAETEEKYLVPADEWKDEYDGSGKYVKMPVFVSKDKIDCRGF